jgi:hypothetical protein
MDSDVMQVCRNGHVITARLRSDPDSGQAHCGRCGAVTIDRCPTCGRELPGAGHVPDLVPIGHAAPPRFCSACGAAYPWTRPPRAAAEPLALLERLLSRLPLVVRQLRWRQGDRPPFRVEDERDLEDLVRGLLPLQFDDVWPESRTPSYSMGTRTDFWLPAAGVALTAKFVRPSVSEEALVEQLREDAGHHRGRAGCRVVVAWLHDPEGVLVEPRRIEAAAEGGEEPRVRCVAG